MRCLSVLPLGLNVQGVRGASVGEVLSRLLGVQQRLVVVLHGEALVRFYRRLSTLITRPEEKKE